MAHPARKFLILAAVGALLGAVFAAVSTHDFLIHLDRQVHSITCSFIPGLGKLDETGSSGCYTVMMSPYSSVLRDRFWGGIPIALPGLGVFAYLLFLAGDILVRKRDDDPAETRWLLLATLIPVATSAYYFYVSKVKVGTVCKLCIGIYVASLLAFAAALVAHIVARNHADPDAAKRPFLGRYALFFLEGLLFVAVPVAALQLVRPSYSEASARCGELAQPEDKYGVLIPLAPHPGGVPAIEVLDPLCPACDAFRHRLDATGRAAELDIKAVLFPLEDTCNWMVSDRMHPGSCAVSEAVLCAGARAPEVVAWALARNLELRKLAKDRPEAILDRIRQDFPGEIAACVGTPTAKARLNRSLRWVAANSLPVLTPQLYIRGKKLCDEDTDLGLEFALGRLLAAPAQPAQPTERKQP